MMRKVLYSVLLIFLFAAISCDEEDPKDIIPDSDMVLSDEAYADIKSAAFSIDSARIDGDSLRVMLRYGGGCGDVEAKLYAASSVMESYPVQRATKIAFDDNDYCKAIVTSDFAFDLKPIRVKGNSQVIIQLEKWDTGLNYSY